MPQKVNAIANGYAILKFLAAQEKEQGVTVIARSTQVSPSSCFNILRTLVELELVKFDQRSKGYSLGLGIFELARMGLAQDPILAAAQPLLLTLARKHNATLSLWDIVHNSESVLIAMGENSSPARLQLQIGTRLPSGAGATGRANLSLHEADTDWLKTKFSEVRWQAPIEFDEYLDDLKNAKADGYAIDRDKYYAGVSAVSSAFEDSKTGRTFCITAVLLSGAHDENSLRRVGRDLKRAAAELKHSTASS